MQGVCPDIYPLPSRMGARMRGEKDSRQGWEPRRATEKARWISVSFCRQTARRPTHLPLIIRSRSEMIRQSTGATYLLELMSATLSMIDWEEIERRISGQGSQCLQKYAIGIRTRISSWQSEKSAACDLTIAMTIRDPFLRICIRVLRVLLTLARYCEKLFRVSGARLRTFTIRWDNAWHFVNLWQHFFYRDLSAGEIPRVSALVNELRHIAKTW